MAVAGHVPVSTDDIRDYLKIDAAKTSMNTRLETIANGVATAINKYLNVAMIATTYTEVYDGWDDNGYPRGNKIFIPRYPIVSITSIANDDIALASDEYYLYENIGKIILKNKSFTTDYQTIDIVYKAGHGTDADAVPYDLKLAVLKWTKVIYEGDVVDFSQQLGEGSVAQIVREKIPKDVLALINPYRAIGI